MKLFLLLLIGLNLFISNTCTASAGNSSSNGNKNSNENKKMKILYIGDLHIGGNIPAVEVKVSKNLIKRAKEADLVFICGDITDAGRPEQYARFNELYAPIKHKSILIRGNHDMGNYMQDLKSWYPDNLKLNFHPGEYPVWVWTTNWFEMLNANTKSFSLQQKLPPPYNDKAQPPVIVVYDGLGPYFYFEKANFRFIVLDSATHQLGAAQRKWLKKTIEESKLPVLIQIHTHVIPGGSHSDASCPLWDSRELLQHFIHNEKVIGMFAAHLHYNSVWDWKGKKIVLTGAYGESRFVEVENGKITYIEPRDNQSRTNIPERFRGLVHNEPLKMNYWCPDGVLAKNTFWVFREKGLFDDALPVKTHWGWHNPNGVGGLVWSIPPEFLPEKEVWFSVNFRSTTPWKLLLEENGKETVVSQGKAGDNIIATGSFGKGPKRPFRRVILRQDAPALGHSCCYMALHDTPKPEFRPYDWSNQKR